MKIIKAISILFAAVFILSGCKPHSDITGWASSMAASSFESVSTSSVSVSSSSVSSAVSLENVSSELNASSETDPSDSGITPSATPTPKPVNPVYGFSSDRFGAAGTRYASEATKMGTSRQPAEMLNFTDAQKDQQKTAAKKIMQDIRNAFANGIKQVYIKPGYYRFGGFMANFLSLNSVQNLEIIGGPGVHFIQTDDTKPVILLQNCKNVVVKGITVDYENSSFVQGTVQSVDSDGNPTFTVDRDYASALERLQKSLIGKRVLYYDKDDKTREKVNSLSNGFIESIKAQGGGQYYLKYDSTPSVLTLQPSINIRKGDKIVIPNRGGGNYTVDITDCEKVTLEDVDIYATSGGPSIRENGGAGGNTFRRVRIIRRPGTDRLLATSADAFHSTDMVKGALIEKCEFSYGEDDLMNYHSFNGFVSQVISPTEIEIVFPLVVTVNKGATATIFDHSSFSVLGNVTISSLTRITDQSVLDSYNDFDSRLSIVGISVRSFPTPTVYRIKLTKAVNAKNYDVFSCQSNSGAGLIVRDSYFHDGHAHSFLATGPNVTFKNNIIRRMAGSLTIIRGGYWSEGPYPSGIIIENNLFEETNMAFESQLLGGAITVYAATFNSDGSLSDSKEIIRDITIRNNEFKNLRSGALFAYNTDHLTFTGNTVTNYFTQPIYDRAKVLNANNGFPNVYYGVYIDTCKNATVQNNTFSGRGTDGIGDIYIGTNTENVIR